MSSLYDTPIDDVFCSCKCKDCMDEDYPIHCWNNKKGCYWQEIDTMDIV